MSQAVTPESTGTFEIHTAAGTELLLELDSTGGHLTRRPGMARPEGHSEPARLPGDFAPLPLVSLPALAVGSPAIFEVLVGEDVETRPTAPITLIRAA